MSASILAPATLEHAVSDSLSLVPSQSVVVVIDWQERLAAAMKPKRHEKNLHKAEILVAGAIAAGVPVLATEQYPKGLGPTVPTLAALLEGVTTPIEKRDFACTDVPEFVDALEATRATHVVLSGMEAHVCVYQSARGLLDLGYHVHVAMDAVLSRRKFDFEVAGGLYAELGVHATSVEVVLFDWVRRAEGEVFKAISRLVR